ITESPAQQILWASEKGRLDIVSNLIEEDASLIHVKDDDDYTPLHRASYNNHSTTVKALLRAGSSVNAVTVDGWTPLHSSCKWNSHSCVSLLLYAGADVNAKTNSGQTPLHLAASNRNAKETIQILLIHFLVDTSVVNSVGETAKQIAERCGPFGYMFEGVGDVLNPFQSD
ncbi:UNVERIFIED_CONTAM: hypothetical protein GTU68_060842, partial [Idotea baltica]|nr:hypothetical protein [Idotea baltica]